MDSLSDTTDHLVITVRLIGKVCRYKIYECYLDLHTDLEILGECKREVGGSGISVVKVLVY